MDYKKLLIAYLDIVGAEEGIDFLEDSEIHDCDCYVGPGWDQLTIEERKELIRVAAETRAKAANQ